MNEDIKNNISHWSPPVLFSPNYYGSPTPGRSRDIRQETADGGHNLLSPDDPLERLWDYIDFRDAFSDVLNVKYVMRARAKYWPHLAEQFGIKRTTYDAFSTSDINSPAEALFEYLEATQPTYNVQEFYKDCTSKEVDANEVSRIVENSVEVGSLANEDLVSEICDKAPYVLDVVILKLDRENSLWQNLARIRNIPRKTYMAFQRDTTTNPARLFFDVLRMQGPEITVGDLKAKSKHLKVEMVPKILEKFEISDEILLKDLSRNSPAAKSEIESFLNNLKTDYLWNLAFLYQKEGLMEDIDLEMVFRHQASDHNPTYEVMKYVLARSSQPVTIKDLIVKLWNINRKDCFDILQPYLRGGKEDINKITDGLGKLRPPKGRKPQPSIDDEGSSSIPLL